MAAKNCGMRCVNSVSLLAQLDLETVSFMSPDLATDDLVLCSLFSGIQKDAPIYWSADETKSHIIVIRVYPSV